MMKNRFSVGKAGDSGADIIWILGRNELQGYIYILTDYYNYTAGDLLRGSYAIERGRRVHTARIKPLRIIERTTLFRCSLACRSDTRCMSFQVYTDDTAAADSGPRSGMQQTRGIRCELLSARAALLPLIDGAEWNVYSIK